VDSSDSATFAAAVEFYAPQVRAYMRGLAASEGVPLDRVEGVLAFLTSGIVQRIENP
jgi:hypothetical protein